MAHRRPSWLLLIVVLSVAACGARLDASQTALARGGGRTAGSSPTGATSTTGPAAVAAPGATGAGGGAGTADAPGPPAGAPDAGTGPAAGPTCTPQPGSTDPGVTDTSITLGNVSTLTGPIPGFGQTGLNGVKAYLAYVNATKGGVCGRKLNLESADDRLDAAQGRSVTQQLSSRVLGFVGGTTVVDNGSAAALEGTNIASCSLAIGDAAIRSPSYFSPNPIDPSGQTQGTTKMWEYFKATRGITKVGIVYPAQTDGRARALAYIPDIQGAGLQVDGPYEVAIAETNYTGVATKMKNDGADAFLTALEINGMARLAQAVQQIGYKPKVAFYGAQAYGKDFLKLAGSAAEGAAIGLAYSIFEDAPSNSSMAAFVEWYQRTAPGSNPDFFSVMGWAAADMMVQALEAAGPAPTRDKVMSFLQGLRSFDAHGILAPNDPAGKRASPQFLIVTVTGGQWVREHPASGFADS